jgi:hypothetical protein
MQPSRLRFEVALESNGLSLQSASISCILLSLSAIVLISKESMLPTAVKEMLDPVVNLDDLRVWTGILQDQAKY